MKPVELKVNANGQEKTYKLVLGNAALFMLEDEFGLTLSELTKQEVSVKKITLILYAALKRHHPNITLDDVHEIIDALGYEKVAEVMKELFEKAFPTMAQSMTSTKTP